MIILIKAVLQLLLRLANIQETQTNYDNMLNDFVYLKCH